jgi:hypothetical protein
LVTGLPAAFVPGDRSGAKHIAGQRFDAKPVVFSIENMPDAGQGREDERGVVLVIEKVFHAGLEHPPVAAAGSGEGDVEVGACARRNISFQD